MAKAFKVYGGPCHWDIVFTFFVAMTKKCANRPDINAQTPAAQAAALGRLAQRLENKFNDFFNPKAKQGIYTLFDFPPCCNFHMTIQVKVAPGSWNGKDVGDIKGQLANGEGVVVFDDLGWVDHPRVPEIGGQVVVLSPDSRADVVAHELGHILGLPDRYKTPYNNLTPEEEKRWKGTLMGKAKPGGKRRELKPEDIEDIAARAGLSCDEEKCCKKKRNSRTTPEPKERGLKTGCAVVSPKAAVVGVAGYFSGRARMKRRM